MKLLTTGVLTLSLILTFQPGAAQSPPGDDRQDVEQLPEIVVSASRVPLETKAVGSAVTVITAEEIERKQVRVLSDLLRDVPGIAVHRSGTMGTLTAVRIRGSEHGHTLVLIDGVKVNDPSSSGAIYNFADLLAADIERIEILRGPQSGLYGSDAIGGVIHITTKKGRGPVTGNVSVEGGSFGTGSVSAGIQGGGHGHHFSLGAADLRTSGISIAAGDEKDGYRNRTYSARLGLQPADDLQFEFTGRYVKARVETDNVPTDNDDRTDSDQAMGRGRLQYSLLEGDWRHALGAAVHRKRRTVVSRWGTDEYDGRKTRFDYETNLFFETTAVPDASHAVTFVAEQEKDSQKSGGGASEVTNHGYSGEYQLGLWEQLFLSGSARYDDNERFKDTTTFRVTAAYVVDASGTRFHGGYGTGVKNPTLSHLFQQFGRIGPNPDVEPEESKGWDLGVEQNLLEGRLSLDLTYFNNRPTNLIYWNDAGTPYDWQNPETGDDDYYDNLGGTSRIRGLELIARAKPADGLSLSAQYTYTDAKDPDRQPLPRRPEHVASVNLGYGFLDGRAAVDLGIDYNGKQLNRTTDPVMIDDFVLVNVAANYKLGRQMELFGRIDNLFDKDYEEIPGYRTTGIGFHAGVRGTFELFE
ncbi:MAG: TonB-dependent receptor [Deltaproteobacteria bacterium]|nr:TonB-dependent receptor [Deltaproteobacteria bacterium]